jgi:hypothetical protein
MKVPGLIIGGIFLAIGLFFLVTAARDFVDRRQFLATAIRATGTVNRIEKASRLNDLQVVTFTASTGETVEFRSMPARIPHEPGAVVPVLYDPADPRRAEIERYEELWHLIALRAAIGSMLTLFGGGLLSGSRKRRQPS